MRSCSSCVVSTRTCLDEACLILKTKTVLNYCSLLSPTTHSIRCSAISGKWWRRAGSERSVASCLEQSICKNVQDHTSSIFHQCNNLKHFVCKPTATHLFGLRSLLLICLVCAILCYTWPLRGDMHWTIQIWTCSISTNAIIWKICLRKPFLSDEYVQHSFSIDFWWFWGALSI